MNAYELARLVGDLRGCQREYHRTRDLGVLRRRRALEDAVDRAVEEVLATEGDLRLRIGPPVLAQGPTPEPTYQEASGAGSGEQN